MNNTELMMLSFLVNDNNIYFKHALKEEDFLTAKNRMIYKTIVKLINSGVEADEISINQENNSITILELMDIKNLTMSTQDSNYYYKNLVDKSTQHYLNKLPEYISQMINKEKLNNSDVIRNIENEIINITSRTSKDKITTQKEAFMDTVEYLKQRALSKNKKVMLTGFDAIDSRINGLKPNEMVTIGARPSAGKTALGLQILKNVTRQGYAVGFLSLESSTRELIVREISEECNLFMSRIKSNDIHDADFAHIKNHEKNIMEGKVFYYGVPNMLWLELRNQARRLKTMHKIDLLMIDYFGLIKPEKSNSPRHEQMAEISKGLKELARELEIPIVLFAQLTRAAENEEPTMAHLAETRQLEFDSDVVIFINKTMTDREVYQQTQEQGRDIIKTIKNRELIIAKARDGRTGISPINFQGNVMRFTEFEEFKMNKPEKSLKMKVDERKMDKEDLSDEALFKRPRNNDFEEYKKNLGL